MLKCGAQNSIKLQAFQEENGDFRRGSPNTQDEMKTHKIGCGVVQLFHTCAKGGLRIQYSSWWSFCQR